MQQGGNLRGDVARHLGGAYVPQGAQRQAGDEVVAVLQIVLDRVGDHHRHLLSLVEEHHQAEVADPLLRKRRARDQRDALHLPPVRRVPEHVQVHQLGDIAVREVRLGILQGRADGGGFLGDQGALLRRGLARADGPDQIPGLIEEVGGGDRSGVASGWKTSEGAKEYRPREREHALKMVGGKAPVLRARARRRGRSPQTGRHGERVSVPGPAGRGRSRRRRVCPPARRREIRGAMGDKEYLRPGPVQPGRGLRPTVFARQNAAACRGPQTVVARR